mmetsp:Transcript_6426/g.7902  ORF Transcript_6426/g.7902 Transcript_6426/m.7902 type:complete len:138 (+) Transcript_6426:481-894(+)
MNSGASAAEGKASFDSQIDILKKSFLGVIQVALYVAGADRANHDPKQLGSRLEDFNTVCDDLYAQIYAAKQQIIHQNLIGEKEGKMREAQASDDPRANMQTRAEVLDEFTKQIEELSSLKEFISTLPPAIEPQEGQS